MIKIYKSAREELDKVIFPTLSQVKTVFVSVIIVVTTLALFLMAVNTIIEKIAVWVMG